jgi:hypothetical protein
VLRRQVGEHKASLPPGEAALVERDLAGLDAHLAGERDPDPRALSKLFPGSCRTLPHPAHFFPMQSTNKAVRCDCQPTEQKGGPRAVAGASVAAALAAVGVLPAAADPLAQCPASYELGGLTGPVSVYLDQHGNNDGYVCRLPFRAGEHEGSNNVIDNKVPLNAQVP